MARRDTKFLALRELNDHSPINRLPSELLLRIFYLNAYRSYRHDYCSLEMGCLTDILPSQLRDVINASSVCHRWRSVVNSAPELWCHLVDPLHPRGEWRNLVLERSKPLGISYVPGKRELTLRGGISKGTEQNKRLTHYRFQITPKERIGWPTGPNSWPELEFLCVYMRVPVDWNNMAEDHMGTLPFEFPGASTPRLKQLHLHHCIFRTAAHLAHLSKTLTHLHVLNPPLSAAPSIRLWFGIIQSLPLLSSLVLDRAVGQVHNQSLMERQNIELNLEAFTLRDSTRNCAQMLSQITFARPCRFFSLGLEISYPDSDLNFILEHLLPVVHSMSYSPSFTRCALEMETLEFNCLGLREGFQGDKMSPFCLQPHLRAEYLAGSARIALFYKPQQNPPFTHQKFIFESLYQLFKPFLPDVEYFQPPGDLDQRLRESMFDLLAQCQSLYRLELLTRAIWAVVYHSVFRRSRLAVGNPDGHPVFLPSLREIQFLITEYPGDDEDYPHHNELVSFCMRRRESRCAMHRIYNPTYFFPSTGEDPEGGRALNQLRARLGALDVQTVFRWTPEQED